MAGRNLKAVEEDLLNKHNASRSGERLLASHVGSAFQLTLNRQPESKTPLLLEDEVRTQSFVKRKGDDLHNTWKDGNELAQARQAANYDSLSSSSVLGWWTAASKNKKPCGLKTCKAYHVKKNQMTGFIEAEVKPHHKHLIPGLRSHMWESSPRSFGAEESSLGSGNKRPHSVAEVWRDSSVASQPNSLPVSPAIKLCRGPDITSDMSARQRVQALDWRCFGQRNHMTILRKESYETQFNTAAAHNERQRDVDGSFSRPLARRTGPEMSLRDLAKSCRSSFLDPRSLSNRFGRASQALSDDTRIKRDFINLNRSSQRSAWDSQSMEIYSRSRNVSPEASPLGSPLSRMSPLQECARDDESQAQRTFEPGRFTALSRVSPAPRSPLLMGSSTGIDSPISVAQTFGLRPPTEMGFRGRGKYPNRTSAQVVAAGVHAGADSRAGAGDALPKHFYIGQLLRDGQHRAFK